MSQKSCLIVKSFTFVTHSTVRNGRPVHIELVTTSFGCCPWVVVVCDHALDVVHLDVFVLNVVSRACVVRVALALCRSVLATEPVTSTTSRVGVGLAIRNKLDLHDVCQPLPCGVQLTEDEVPAVWTQTLVVYVHPDLLHLRVVVGVHPAVQRVQVIGVEDMRTRSENVVG